MDVLTEDDEVAVNDGLHDFIYNRGRVNDYFKLKDVLMWLRRSYLLRSPLSEQRMDNLMDSCLMQFDRSASKYYAETLFSMTTEIGPMALLPHLWLAEMYKNKGMLGESRKLKDLKFCLQDAFKVVAADTDYAMLRDSKGEEYRLKNVYPDTFREGGYVVTALVKYGDNEWEINGFLSDTGKSVYDSRCERSEQLKVSYELAYPMYMERTNGKRLAFFENTSQLNDWLKRVAPEIDTEEIGSQLPTGARVAFISKKAGIIFAPHMTHAIKCEYNPFYRKCDASTMQNETMDAICNIEAMHPEMLQYLLENKMLQDGDLSSRFHCDLGNRIFTLNIDFIARNHRRHYYHDHDY